MTRAGLLLLALSAGVLAGCDGHDEEQPKVVRPVLSVVVQPVDHGRIGFAGLIEPRYRTDRAFQVLGRIVARKVDVGDLVKKGQTLAQNDPLAYELAVRSSEANLTTAKSQLVRTSAQRERTRILVNERISSQADLDSAQQATDAAAASVQQAEAQLAKSREQLSYTTLAADIDGVVTSIDAEVGQMASAGMKVMTLARTDVREAVVDVPEDVARSLSAGAPFSVRLQADPTIVSPGKVREISPQADAATRLTRVRVTLQGPAEPFRLGATITATPKVATVAKVIETPASALFDRDGALRLWIVDEAAKTVRSQPVEVSFRDQRIARIEKGLEPGARVVIAGVRSLSEGQQVKLGKAGGAQ